MKDIKKGDNGHTGISSDILGWKPAFFATMNACMYAATIDDITCPRCYNRIVTYPTTNEGEMSHSCANKDKIELEDRIRNYLKKLDGLQITIPISDIAKDLNMTEECVIKILESWEIKLDDEER